MSKINLRSYNREIETLIDQGKIDLAIAHSLHVLKFFPKHVDTYRLLGKAYLENQRLGDAADVFQRVLSAVPDDFVSHIGMSIIREDEGNLDASIWHMQRAYDVQSSNITIQDELRRLYDKRDGIEPPKIRLTRAALARMYARGDLITEAITELRSALQEEPERADLLVLLAGMYYNNQQRVKCIQTCSQVLNKLPYCLEANLIISQALNDTNRTEEAGNYLDRAKELEPYAAYLSEHATAVNLVPDAAVMLTKLDETDFLTGTDSAQPAWVTSLGEEMPTQGEAIDDSDWLFEEAPEAETEDEVDENVDFEIDDELAETLAASEAFRAVAEEVEETEAEEESASENEFETALFGDLEDEEEEPIPDWMQEAGWQSRDPSLPEEAPPSPETELDQEAAMEGDLTPAEIPDWLQAMAPKELTEDTLPHAVLPDEKALDEPAAADIPDWLQEFETEEETVPPVPAPISESQKSEEIPDWLIDEGDVETTIVPPTADAAQEDIPEWLRDLAEQAGEADVEEVVPQTGEAAQFSDEFALEETEPVAFETPETPADTTELATEPQEALPDWLQEMDDETISEAEPAEIGETAHDWLASLETRDVSAVEVPEDEDELPEWLLDIGEEEETSSASEDRTGVSLWLRRNAEVGSGAGDQDEESVDAREVEFENIFDAEAETADYEAVSADSEVEDTIQTERPAELAEVLDPESTTTTDRAETPAWLKGLDDELLSEDEPREEEEEEEEEKAEAFEELADITEPEPAGEEASLEGEMPDLEDAEATFRWLESLAARQGAREDELLTTPEERSDEPPEWIRTIAESAAEEVEAEAEAPEEDWLAELSDEDIPESQIAENPIESDTLDWGDIEKEVEAVPQSESDSVEEDLSWLEELTLEENEEEFLVQPEETVEDVPAWSISPAVEDEDIPDWLKEEIEEQPEEAAEQELPDWLQEVEIDEEDEEEVPASDLPAWLEEPAEEEEVSVPESEPGELPEETPAEEVMEAEADGEEVYAWEQEETVLEESGEQVEEKETWWQKETGPLDISALGDEEEAPQEEEEEEEEEEEIEPQTVIVETAPALEVTETPGSVEEKTSLESVEVSELAGARTALASGDVGAAISEYRKSIRKKRHLSEIIADLNEALQYNHPVNIDIWTALGDAFAKDEQLQNALDAYTKAEELLR